MYCLHKNFLPKYKNILSYKKNKLNILNYSYNFLKNENLFSFNNYYRKNYIVFLFKVNNTYYYNLNKSNNLNHYNFILFINNLCYNGYNFLLIDNDKKQTLPLINYIFGLKNVYEKKNFFFIDKKSITHPNFFYFYKNFIKKQNIKNLFFLNYMDYFKFFKFFLKLNISLSAIIPHNLNTIYFDYFIISYDKNIELNKLIILNFISNIVFYNFNLKNFKLRFFFYINYLKLNVKNF